MKGVGVRRSVLLTFAAALVAAAGGASQGIPAAASPRAAVNRTPVPFDAVAFRRQHGYLPLRGVATLVRAKAHAAAEAAAMHHQGSTQAGRPLRTRAGGPKVGASWEGPLGPTPPDANGAVGPNSYIEITNGPVTIYTRTGEQIATAPLVTLTGNLSGGDPMIIWDPDTQRFYYSTIGPGSTIDWGFSKDDNPTTIPDSFCRYDTSFGFPTGSIPDYPKLGQTKGFLMIGINFYPAGSQVATEADLLWTGKPQGSGPITTCPDASTFKSGIFHDLRNQDGSQAFTPVPAIQTDPSAAGYVMAMSDIECPPTCGEGTLLTTYTLKPKKHDPTVPKLSIPRSLTVGSYQSPPDAPQKDTDRLLDTLDGRITHAVSGIDPAVGRTTVWVSHCVLGGAGAEVRWYEVRPGKKASVLQSGAATDPSLYVFNGGISNDRTVNEALQTAHGDAMVLGFNTSSSSTYVAVQMISKRGSKPQSGFVMVHQSTGPFAPVGSCGLLGCRWGDYSGATPDPAADVSAIHGEVWSTNEFTDGDSHRPTWNWEAMP